MKPAWDQLMDEFSSSTTSLIADVDCTADGKPLCETHGVQGFPTIKHGDPADLQDYSGGRDFDSLKKFAEENLGPQLVQQIWTCVTRRSARSWKVSWPCLLSAWKPRSQMQSELWK